MTEKHSNETNYLLDFCNAIDAWESHVMHSNPESETHSLFVWVVSKPRLAIWNCNGKHHFILSLEKETAFDRFCKVWPFNPLWHSLSESIFGFGPLSSFFLYDFPLFSKMKCGAMRVNTFSLSLLLINGIRSDKLTIERSVKFVAQKQLFGWKCACNSCSLRSADHLWHKQHTHGQRIHYTHRAPIPNRKIRFE